MGAMSTERKRIEFGNNIKDLQEEIRNNMINDDYCSKIDYSKNNNSELLNLTNNSKIAQGNKI